MHGSGIKTRDKHLQLLLEPRMYCPRGKTLGKAGGAGECSPWHEKSFCVIWSQNHGAPLKNGSSLKPKAAAGVAKVGLVMYIYFS